MTRKNNLFPRSSFVGFDHMFEELERIANSAGDHYPPYNILKTDKDKYLIEIAVAGFSEDELNIELKDRTLTVTGEHVSKDREYVYRGISTKKFARSFRLYDYVEVRGAKVTDGILAIVLKVNVPEALRPRKIPIGKNEVEDDNTTKELLREAKGLSYSEYNL